MSQAALERRGADLAQAEAPEMALLIQEAQRLSQLAAEFALFGLRIEPLDLGEAFCAVDSAAAVYRTDIPPPTPANDVDPERQFPSLDRRGVHIDPRLPTQMIQAFDWLASAAAAEVAAHWGAGAGLENLNVGAAAVFLACAACLKVGMWLTESYRGAPAHAHAERGLGGLTLGAILGIVIANAFAPDVRSAAALSATLPLSAMLMALAHAGLAAWTRKAHAKGWFAETVLLVGATEAASRMAKRAAKTGSARIVAVVDDRLARAPREVGGVAVSGDLNAAFAWKGLPHIDRIVIAVTPKAEARVREIIKRLRTLPHRVDLLLDVRTQRVRGRGFDKLAGAAVASIAGRAHNGRRALVKRCEDLVLGGLAAIILAPVFLTLALLVKLDGKGPVLTRQRRHGFNNRIISVLSFRTQTRNGGMTRIGALLHRSGLEALPSLLNVLRGDMSLVGPRPHAVDMKAHARGPSDIVAEYAHRHRTKPGIFGWAQLNGAHGPLNTAAQLRQHIRLDLEYVARASLWFDLQILARAIAGIFTTRARAAAALHPRRAIAPTGR
jgi:lipopolysaccharide/colanic/teichoic acid biosynthesis glycosyltransferase